jgi:hypothetical protein
MLTYALAQVLLVSPSLTDLQIDEVEQCSAALQEEVQVDAYADVC